MTQASQTIAAPSPVSGGGFMQHRTTIVLAVLLTLAAAWFIRATIVDVDRFSAQQVIAACHPGA